jgi:hypothetical protein
VDLREARGEAQQWKRFQHGLAVLEAKRWNRALDRADKKDPSEEGVPSTQMLQYLSRVDVQTNNKVRLGILTTPPRHRTLPNFIPGPSSTLPTVPVASW